MLYALSNGWIVGLVAPCLLTASAALGQTIAAPATPAGGAVELAVTLARNDAPAGLVAPRPVLVGRRAAPSPSPTAAGKAAFQEGLARMIERFNASGTAFRARSEGGVVHVRSPHEPPEVTKALRQPVRIETRVTASVLVLLRGPIVQAMRGSAPSEGYLYAGLMPSSECSLLAHVRPPEGRATALELLDEIVRQLPGRVWLATYDPAEPRQTLKVGILCRDGSDVLVDVDP